jgi:hypothetical protein
MALTRYSRFEIREHTALLPTSLLQIARPDSGLSARTVADYSWTWQKYVDPPRHRHSAVSHCSKRMIPSACAASCSGSLRHTVANSVLHGVIGYAVDNGVLSKRCDAPGAYLHRA